MANPPTSAADPGLLDLTGKSILPWWKDGGLRKLILWQTCISAAQITVGFDEVIIGSFQALQPWQDGKLIGQRILSACDAKIIQPWGIHLPRFWVLSLAWYSWVALSAQSLQQHQLIATDGALRSKSGHFWDFLDQLCRQRLQVGAFSSEDVSLLVLCLSFTTTAGPSLLIELAHPRLRGKVSSMVSDNCFHAFVLHISY